MSGCHTWLTAWFRWWIASVKRCRLTRLKGYTVIRIPLHDMVRAGTEYLRVLAWHALENLRQRGRESCFISYIMFSLSLSVVVVCLSACLVMSSRSPFLPFISAPILSPLSLSLSFYEFISFSRLFFLSPFSPLCSPLFLSLSPLYFFNPLFFRLFSFPPPSLI